jgi:hypothetical protein
MASGRRKYFQHALKTSWEFGKLNCAKAHAKGKNKNGGGFSSVAVRAE